MIDRALEGKFAYPAINVSSLTMANAVLKGLADSKSDGIIQVSTGGGAFASGAALKDMAFGAIPIAEHFRFEYPFDDDRRVIAHLEYVRTLPQEAKELYL
jgi:fructose/tagatose bisphosphate aldolase